MSNSRVAVITFLDGGGGAYPDQGLPGGGYPSHGLPGGGYPSHGLPSGGYPSHGLPGGGHIALLPVFPFDPTRPDQGLPSAPGSPDNTLPGGGAGGGTRPSQPIAIVPGAKFVVKWLACQGLILVPDQGLPETTPPTPTPAT